VDSGILEKKMYYKLIEKSEELMKILTSIVKTGQEKLKTQH